MQGQTWLGGWGMLTPRPLGPHPFPAPWTTPAAGPVSGCCVSMLVKGLET